MGSFLPQLRGFGLSNRRVLNGSGAIQGRFNSIAKSDLLDFCLSNRGQGVVNLVPTLPLSTSVHGQVKVVVVAAAGGGNGGSGGGAAAGASNDNDKNNCNNCMITTV